MDAHIIIPGRNLDHLQVSQSVDALAFIEEEVRSSPSIKLNSESSLQVNNADSNIYSAQWKHDEKTER